MTETKKYNVIYTEKGWNKVQDFISEVIDYIQSFNFWPSHYDRLIKAIHKCEDNLSIFPFAFPRAKMFDTSDREYRKIHLISFLWFVYYVNNNNVYIDMLLNTRQDQKYIDNKD